MFEGDTKLEIPLSTIRMQVIKRETTPYIYRQYRELIIHDVLSQLPIKCINKFISIGNFSTYESITYRL